MESIVNNLKNGRVCAAFTIEMNIEAFMQRIYCHYADVSFEKISKKTYTIEEKERLRAKTVEFKELFSGKFFILFTTEGLTCKHVESYIVNLRKADVIVDDIFIDYLQILDSYTKNNAPKPEKMAEIPKEVRLLRQKTNARIIIPIQSLTSSRDKAIEDWSPDDIYYAKEAEREFDYVAAMKEEDGYVKWKQMVSRFSQDDEVLFFPDKDFSLMYFGQVSKWDDAYAKTEEDNDVELFEPNSWKKRGE